MPASDLSHTAWTHHRDAVRDGLIRFLVSTRTSRRRRCAIVSIALLRAIECFPRTDVDDIIVSNDVGVIEDAPVLQEGLLRRRLCSERAELGRTLLQELCQGDPCGNVENLCLFGLAVVEHGHATLRHGCCFAVRE